MTSGNFFGEVLAREDDDALAAIEEALRLPPPTLTRADWYALASSAAPLATTNERWHRVAIQAYEKASWAPNTATAWTAGRLRVDYITRSGPDVSDPLRNPAAVFTWVRSLARGLDPIQTKKEFVRLSGTQSNELTASERMSLELAHALQRALLLAEELARVGIVLPPDIEEWLAPLGGHGTNGPPR